MGRELSGKIQVCVKERVKNGLERQLELWSIVGMCGNRRQWEHPGITRVTLVRTPSKGRYGVWTCHLV